MIKIKRSFGENARDINKSKGSEVGAVKPV